MARDRIPAGDIAGSKTGDDFDFSTTHSTPLAEASPAFGDVFPVAGGPAVEADAETIAEEAPEVDDNPWADPDVLHALHHGRELPSGTVLRHPSQRGG